MKYHVVLDTSDGETAEFDVRAGNEEDAGKTAIYKAFRRWRSGALETHWMNWRVKRVEAA